MNFKNQSKLTTSISKEESVIKPAATETNDMAAKFMKSAEKSKEEAKAQAAEMEGFEQKEALFESAARHGFKFGTVINPQNLQKKNIPKTLLSLIITVITETNRYKPKFVITILSSNQVDTKNSTVKRTSITK